MSCESANYPEQDPMCDCFGCFEKRYEASEAIEAAVTAKENRDEV